MKYAAAYCLCVVAGKEKPKAADIKKIITAAGGECDDAEVKKLISELDGKDACEVIAKGRETLKSAPMGGGGGGGAAPAGGGAAAGGAPAAAAKAAEPEV